MVSCTEPGSVSPGNKLISEERKVLQEKSAIVFIVFLPKICMGKLSKSCQHHIDSVLLQELKRVLTTDGDLLGGEADNVTGGAGEVSREILWREMVNH